MEEDGCAERLACRLGDLAKENFQDKDLVLGEINIQPPTVVCKMLEYIQSEHIYIAYTFLHVWCQFACSVGAC